MYLAWLHFDRRLCLEQKHIRKTEVTGNNDHQNGLVNLTQVKTPYKQKTLIYSVTNVDLRNTTLRYGFRFTPQILERFQSKVLRMIVGTPWYLPNKVIRSDLQTQSVKEKICRYNSQYNARLSVHPDDMLVNLIAQPEKRRLRILLPNDL
jgi:hypothetical protein